MNLNFLYQHSKSGYSVHPLSQEPREVEVPPYISGWLPAAILRIWKKTLLLLPQRLFFGYCWVHGKLNGKAFLDLKKYIYFFSRLKPRGSKEAVFCNRGNMACMKRLFLRSTK